MPKRRLILCVSGMAGSGKSTLARRLADKYNLKYYSGGDVLKTLAIEDGHKASDRGWWESPNGTLFMEKRCRDSKFDELVDKKFLKLAKEGDVILDSWTMPWLLKEGFKIWLEASPQTRAQRIARRNGISVQRSLKALRRKEEKTKAIYNKLYGFSLGEDLEPFDLILDTENLNGEEVFHIICMVIDNVVMKQKKLKRVRQLK